MRSEILDLWTDCLKPGCKVVCITTDREDELDVLGAVLAKLKPNMAVMCISSLYPVDIFERAPSVGLCTLGSWKAMRDNIENKSFEFCKHTLMLYKATDHHDRDFWAFPHTAVPANMSLVVFTSSLPGTSHRNGFVVLGRCETRVAFDYTNSSHTEESTSMLQATPVPAPEETMEQLFEELGQPKAPSPMLLQFLPKTGVFACIGQSRSGRTTMVNELLATLQKQTKYIVLAGKDAQKLNVLPSKTVLRLPHVLENPWDCEHFDAALQRIMDHQKQTTLRHIVVIVIDAIGFNETETVGRLMSEAEKLDIALVITAFGVGIDLMSQEACNKIDLLFAAPYPELALRQRLHTAFFSKHYSVGQFEKMIQATFTEKDMYKFLAYSRSSDSVHTALVEPKTGNL